MDFSLTDHELHMAYTHTQKYKPIHIKKKHNREKLIASGGRLVMFVPGAFHVFQPRARLQPEGALLAPFCRFELAIAGFESGALTLSATVTRGRRKGLGEAFMQHVQHICDV